MAGISLNRSQIEAPDLKSHKMEHFPRLIVIIRQIGTSLDLSVCDNKVTLSGWMTFLSTNPADRNLGFVVLFECDFLDSID